MIQLSNTGNAALVITGATITGPDAGSYSLTNGCPGTLAVGASACNLYITFKPTSTASPPFTRPSTRPEITNCS